MFIFVFSGQITAKSISNQISNDASLSDQENGLNNSSKDAKKEVKKDVKKTKLKIFENEFMDDILHDDDELPPYFALGIFGLLSLLSEVSFN